MDNEKPRHPLIQQLIDAGIFPESTPFGDADIFSESAPMHEEHTIYKPNDLMLLERFLANTAPIDEFDDPTYAKMLQRLPLSVLADEATECLAYANTLAAMPVMMLQHQMYCAEEALIYGRFALPIGHEKGPNALRNSRQDFAEVSLQLVQAIYDRSPEPIRIKAQKAMNVLETFIIK